jgi:ribosomal-protein-alanine N-acetyltransferase
VPDAETCIRWAGPKLKFPFSPPQLPQLLAEPGAHSFVLSRGQARALGFCQFWVRDPGVAHLARIILAPVGTRPGPGAPHCALLMAEAAHSRRRQRLHACASTATTIPALAIYEGLGFVAVPVERSDERIFFMRAVR